MNFDNRNYKEASSSEQGPTEVYKFHKVFFCLFIKLAGQNIVDGCMQKNVKMINFRGKR